ncbi:hypothetical protein FNJ88_06075 [Chryseobacterium sp. SNU WT5]|uniref:hypothetical protein n=1 Tax=Chryseobacterium sp. SNU WT5 TaxID=2594269 RepID=UPI00117DE319|nr:hypothetical protein [Chryseobacterium sp. SNU WT5]QDP85151.1 hypothetical protein FNJ88_06075 [Chryseobacterium sp. SNU WT5]
MLKTLKIFLIVLGLGIFILPKQMIFAQSVIECGDKMTNTENCCKTEKTESCHTDNSDRKSEKSNCEDDCTQCHFCTVNFVLNFLLPEINENSPDHLFTKTLNFNYGISYFSSSFENIWQPPKIG